MWRASTASTITGTCSKRRSTAMRPRSLGRDLPARSRRPAVAGAIAGLEPSRRAFFSSLPVPQLRSSPLGAVAAYYSPEPTHQHPSPQQQDNQPAKSLFSTLLASQMLLPFKASSLSSTAATAAAAAAAVSQQRQVDQEDDLWIRFFAHLGSSTGVVPDAEDASAAWSHSNAEEPAAQEHTATLDTQEEPALEPPVTHETRDETPRATLTTSSRPDVQKRRLEQQLARYITEKNPQRAMDAFHLGLRFEIADDLQPDTVRKLFFLMVRKRPFDSYKVLKHYQKITAEEHSGDMNAYADMYERNCYSLRFMNPEMHRYTDIHKLVRCIVMDLQSLDRVGKELCYPVLVSALISQKSVSVGDFARLAYEYMVEHNFTVPAGYWEHLLSMSRYFRQKDLPYAAILRRIVDMGRRPDPVTTLNALENLFPYTDVESTYIALKAIVDLQSTAKPEDEHQYVVDISALEVIGAAAARAGHYPLSLLLWDLIDLLGYHPTEAIYENTIIVFAAQPETYGNAFTVLADMEASGYEPSRALIRGLSLCLRESPHHLDHAMNHVQALRKKGTSISASALNAIMSGGAERGDIDRTVFMLEEFPRNDVEPNADTFSFAFEALGKNVARKNRKPASKALIDSYLRKADSFLTAMEEQGIAPTGHIAREYVELLCLAGEVETATAIVTDSIASNGIVNSKTIYRVAMANVTHKNFDVAREVASSATEPLPFLLETIESAERRESTR